MDIHSYPYGYSLKAMITSYGYPCGFFDLEHYMRVYRATMVGCFHISIENLHKRIKVVSKVRAGW